LFLTLIIACHFPSGWRKALALLLLAIDFYHRCAAP
jgi:hypothetical protein